jgi:tetratricopeptide (TPR) repeat protein
MTMVRILSFFFVLFLGILASGQVLKTDLNRRIDVGKEMMLGGSYDSADYQFSIVLQKLQPLPSEMAYLYGRNSYHLGKYKRAINWLNKYIQLKGARGIHYEETVQYLQLSEEAYIKERKENALAVSEELATTDFDCGGLGKMLCPVCSGSGVIIEPGKFDPIYKTCPYSLGEGFLSCEDYNLFMKGKLEPKISDQ